MNFAIFCPSSHLILSAPGCPKCGWKRPPAVKICVPAWESVQLKAGLGGPGRQVFAYPAVCGGVLACPLKNGQIVGVDVRSGKELWRIILDEGQVTRQLLTDGERFLFSTTDERPIGQTGLAQLASMEAVSGKRTTLWQDSGHQLSAPLLTENLILLRTNSGLVAFRRSAQPELLWRLPLKTWWVLAPFVAEEMVFVWDGIAIQNVGQLLAYDMKDRRQVWGMPTNGMLSQPITSAKGTIIFQNGRHQITAVEAVNGTVRWKQEFDKLYSPPVACEDLVVFVSRGAAEQQAADHYVLNALDAASGSLRWQCALPGRVILPALCQNGNIYLASDDGRLFGVGIKNHDLLFEKLISSEEDPLHTGLLIDAGILFCGTYNGLISATRVEQPQETELAGSPADYLAHGKFEEAAAAFALQGDFRSAARLYSGELCDQSKALVLYEHAHLYPEAAALCLALGLHSEAQRFYELSGDLPNLASLLLKRGDKPGAARLFEKMGNEQQAAELYEQINDFAHAAGIYRRLNDRPALLRVSTAAHDTDSLVELLLEDGKVTEAAEACLSAGSLRKAAELFKKADQAIPELETLLKLQESAPEEWLFHRIAHLARKEGRFLQAAQAWEQLNDVRQSAEAYMRAARQAEQLSPEAQQTTGELFQKAETFFIQAGRKVKANESHQKAIHYLRLPNIVIESVPRSAFKEEQFNRLVLKIHNIGNGLARNIHIQVVGNRFEVDGGASDLYVGNLAEGETDEKVIHIQPRAGQVGDTVPLQLSWRWEDVNHKTYPGQISAEVPVLRKDDNRLETAPQTVYIGTLIQGDQIGGDKLDGSAVKQVGDKVEINRNTNSGSASVTLTALEQLPTRTCPKCKMPVDRAAAFCTECGLDLCG